MLRLTFAYGTAPSKWVHRYNEHTAHGELIAHPSADPLEELLTRQADIALIRLPDPRLDAGLPEQDLPEQDLPEQGQVNPAAAVGAQTAFDPADYHQVFLYEEALGVAFPQDHPAKLYDALTPAEISDEILHAIPAAGQAWDVMSLNANLQVVAANVGMQIGPLPLLRAVANKQVVVRELHDPAYATANDPGDPNQRQVAYSASKIVLVWAKASDSPEIQDFVGICKGRRPNSSRQVAVSHKPAKKKKAAQTAKPTAKAKRGQKNPGVSSQRSKNGKGKSRAPLRGKTARKRRG